MSSFRHLTLLAVVAALACSALGQRDLRAREVDLVLSNDRLLTTFVKCLLEKGPCNKDGLELKRLIPQTLATDCAKCTADHKRQTERVIRHLRAKRPRDWASLTAKYDPKGEYERRYAGRRA